MPPSPSRPTRKRVAAGAAPGRGTPAPKRGGAGTPRAGPSEDQIKAAKRIAEIERKQRELEKEKRELLPKTAAMEPPVRGVERFAGRREGFTYHTWFKALGTFAGLQELKGGDSPDILNEMEEEFDGNIPRAFYSHAITGRVKYRGIVKLQKVIDDLNRVADWAPMDFRDVYPKWEYTYRIVESVGDVPVQIYEIRASRPKRKGYRSY